MPVETAADRLAMLSPNDFGAGATYRLAAGGDTALDGIFDAPASERPIGEGAAGIVTRSTFFCRAADLPGGAQGDAGDLLILDGGGSYQVAAIEPDGQGMALLTLIDQA